MSKIFALSTISACPLYPTQKFPLYQSCSARLVHQRLRWSERAHHFSCGDSASGKDTLTAPWGVPDPPTTIHLGLSYNAIKPLLSSEKRLVNFRLQMCFCQNSPLRNIIAKFGFCAKKIAQSFRPMRQMFDSFKSIQTRVKKQSRDWTRPRCFTRACRARKDVYYIQPEPDSSSQVENTNLFRTFLTLFLSRKGRLLYICISTNYARETQILDMFTSFMYY